MARRRKPESYARREPKRDSYDYVLIVCEGAKTETQYFGRLRSIHKLNSANIQITQANGSDPRSIARFAETLYTKNAYDRVYCVFDRDGHQTWDEGLSIIGKYPGVMSAITSWPCFELWVLLHFKYSASPFMAVGKKSACDLVEDEVKKHIADYKKGYPTIYDDLLARMGAAKANAKRLSIENKATGSLNPATNVYELVEYLIELVEVNT